MTVCPKWNAILLQSCVILKPIHWIWCKISTQIPLFRVNFCNMGDPEAMFFPKVPRRTATQMSLFLSVNFLFNPITQDEIAFGNKGASQISRCSSSTPSPPTVEAFVKPRKNRNLQSDLFLKYDFRFRTEVDWPWDKTKCVQLRISWPHWSPFFLFLP